MLPVVQCGLLAGAEDFAEISRWGQRKIDFLRRFKPIARGVPSHDTLNDVLNALPGALFADGFTAWVETLRKAGPANMATIMYFPAIDPDAGAALRLFACTGKNPFRGGSSAVAC